MSRFKVGEKVVCVCDKGYNSHDIPKPIINESYTVYKTGIVNPSRPSQRYIKLTELVSSEDGLGENCHYEHSFAPLEPNVNTKELAKTLLEHLGGEKKEEIQKIKI